MELLNDHAFHRFADVKVKVFSGNSLWSSILNHLQTKVIPRTPILAIFFFSIYNSNEEGVLKILFF